MLYVCIIHAYIQYICTCVYLHSYMYVYLWLNTARLYVCIYHTCTQVHVYAHVNICIHIHEYLYSCMYVYLFVRIQMCARIYTLSKTTMGWCHLTAYVYILVCMCVIIWYPCEHYTYIHTIFIYTYNILWGTLAEKRLEYQREGVEIYTYTTRLIIHHMHLWKWYIFPYSTRIQY